MAPVSQAPGPIVFAHMETATTSQETRCTLTVTRPSGLESRRISACQHTEQLSLVREFRHTLSGRAEPDGRSVVCGSCGDRWRFVDRVQLPEWLRAELIRRGL